MASLTDAEFARAFESGRVTVEAFDHRNHVRLAWAYLRESASDEEALDRMRAAIRAFAAAAGKPERYHETITVLWMRLLSAFITQYGRDVELADVLERHPSLADKDLPLRYYSRDRLFSDEARAAWIDPDLRAI